MNAIAAWLKSVRNDPRFVTAYSLFLGALGSEIYTLSQTGHIDLSLQSVKKMVATALGATAVSLYHLYIQPPNPTVAATFPPSKTPVDVPAQLEPIDPKAVPTQKEPT